MAKHSKLVRMRIVNIGCIGNEGLTVELDRILCLVGANNAGKSTVLRAYEAAVDNKQLAPLEYHSGRSGMPATVEIWVHIPEGVANIPEKWKEIDGELRLVRSRWEWSGSGAPKRSTWDPEAGTYATEDKASGLDTVFASRLPRPLRIGALDDPEEEHRLLLKLLLDPVAKRIDDAIRTDSSPLSQALLAVKVAAEAPLAEFGNAIDSARSKVNEAYRRVFPDGAIDLDVSLAPVEFRPLDSLLKASSFRVRDASGTVAWERQGTGAQRTLFWSMLQARSEISKGAAAVEAADKKRVTLAKEIDKKKKEAAKLKKPEAVAVKESEIEALLAQLETLNAVGAEASVSDEITLPGYMLLIDEPEIALHPAAIRAARAHLYGLASEAGWQVMLSTHSPLFIDPLEDHTTIVRLDRSGGVAPRTFKSDSAAFSADERANLGMLLRFDQALAEMFFGGYPVVIEGDTEFAAFEKLLQDPDTALCTETKPLLIRARGKDLIVPIVKILEQFKVPFSVLHDCDSPRTKSGKRKSSAWSANFRLHDAIEAARSKGVRVTHRVSIPDFERAHGLEAIESSKPFHIWMAVQENQEVANSIMGTLRDLLDPMAEEGPFPGLFKDDLTAAVRAWSILHAPDSPQFSLDASDAPAAAS